MNLLIGHTGSIFSQIGQFLSNLYYFLAIFANFRGSSTVYPMFGKNWKDGKDRASEDRKEVLADSNIKKDENR